MLGFEKNISSTTVTGSNENNACRQLMHLTLYVLISQHSNNVDFMSMGKAQMATKREGSSKLRDWASLPFSRHCKYAVLSHM